MEPTADVAKKVPKGLRCVCRVEADGRAVVEGEARQPIALWRLYLLRIVYAVMAGGIFLTFWPDVLHHTPQFAAAQGIRASLLAGLGVMAALGVRYPLAMLPILMFEFLWKAIYLAAFALPLWRGGTMPADMTGDVQAVLFVVLFVPFVPWDQVVRRFVLAPGDRWR